MVRLRIWDGFHHVESHLGPSWALLMLKGQFFSRQAPFISRALRAPVIYWCGSAMIDPYVSIQGIQILYYILHIFCILFTHRLYVSHCWSILIKGRTDGDIDRTDRSATWPSSSVRETGKDQHQLFIDVSHGSKGSQLNQWPRIMMRCI